MTADEMGTALEAVSEMVVVLSDFPTPAGLQTKIKRVRDYLTEARRLLNKIRQTRNVLENELSLMESELDLRMTELLATDDEVRAGGSVTDRKAMARWKLQDEIKAIDEKRVEVAGAAAAEKMVWEIVKNLDGTSTDIARQMKLLRFDEALGGSTDDGDDDDLPGVDDDDDDEWGVDTDDDDDLTGTSNLDGYFGDNEDDDDDDDEPQSGQDPIGTVTVEEVPAPVQEDGDPDDFTGDDPEPDPDDDEPDDDEPDPDDDEWGSFIEGLDDDTDEMEQSSQADDALSQIVVKKPVKQKGPSDEELDEMLDLF